MTYMMVDDGYGTDYDFPYGNSDYAEANTRAIDVAPFAPQWELADIAANGDLNDAPFDDSVVEDAGSDFVCGTCGNTNPYIIGGVQVDAGETEDDDVWEPCYECVELSHIADALISEG